MKIGITLRLATDPAHGELRSCLDLRLPKLIAALGFTPVLLPYELDPACYAADLGLAGVLLSGGNDLSVNSPQDPLSKMRDEYERSLLDFAIKNALPIFGICRGMQLVAEFFGSSFAKVAGEVRVRHSLRVNGASKYAADLSAIRDVNSYHNYRIEALASELIASATNSVGVIKAIEHKSLRIFAQNWHTERDEPFCQAQMNLIKHFFKGDT